MCTLEPLGYSPSQFFIIPFLVLIKAIDQNAREPSEAMAHAIELISQTCCRILAKSQNMKTQVFETLAAFIASPENRTADIVPDLSVLTVQAMCL